MLVFVEFARQGIDHFDVEFVGSTWIPSVLLSALFEFPQFEFLDEGLLLEEQG